MIPGQGVWPGGPDAVMRAVRWLSLTVALAAIVGTDAAVRQHGQTIHGGRFWACEPWPGGVWCVAWATRSRGGRAAVHMSPPVGSRADAEILAGQLAAVVAVDLGEVCLACGQASGPAIGQRQRCRACRDDARGAA